MTPIQILRERFDACERMCNESVKAIERENARVELFTKERRELLEAIYKLETNP